MTQHSHPSIILLSVLGLWTLLTSVLLLRPSSDPRKHHMRTEIIDESALLKEWLLDAEARTYPN